MTATSEYETAVADRFDALADRFKTAVAVDDARMTALLDAFGTIAGGRLLDVGCGKGRFGAHLARRGAEVVGLDRSAGMLAQASYPGRVRASAARLPFADSSFDGAFAVEVFEHLPRPAWAACLREIGRVLRPGGRFVLIDKNAGAADRRRPWLPSLAVKWIDERRGLWMYPAGGPVRERWLWPNATRTLLNTVFPIVEMLFLLSAEEADSRLHRRVPRARRFVAWIGTAPGGGS